MHVQHGDILVLVADDDVPEQPLARVGWKVPVLVAGLGANQDQPQRPQQCYELLIRD